jgi:hypothetical protein
MDAVRFDTLSRTLGTPVPRRGTLAALLGGALSLRGLTETTLGRPYPGTISTPISVLTL